MDRHRAREEGGSRRVDGSVNKHTGFDDTSTEGRTPTKTQTTTCFLKKSNGMVLMVTLLSIYIHRILSCLYRIMKQSQSQKFRHSPTTLFPFTVTTSLA